MPQLSLESGKSLRGILHACRKRVSRVWGGSNRAVEGSNRHPFKGPL